MGDPLYLNILCDNCYCDTISMASCHGDEEDEWRKTKCHKVTFICIISLGNLHSYTPVLKGKNNNNKTTISLYGTYIITIEIYLKNICITNIKEYFVIINL